MSLGVVKRLFLDLDICNVENTIAYLKPKCPSHTLQQAVAPIWYFEAENMSSFYLSAWSNDAD